VGFATSVTGVTVCAVAVACPFGLGFDKVPNIPHMTHSNTNTPATIKTVGRFLFFSSALGVI
jgi:hypothetical protein